MNVTAQNHSVIVADGLSKELQIGKAAEHIVCADLLLQGITAFQSDAGMPYDLIVDHLTILRRVQVKGTQAPYERQRNDGSTTKSYCSRTENTIAARRRRQERMSK